MDRWKSTGRMKLRHGESQQGGRSEREKARREKMQVREKVGKSPTAVFSNGLWSGSKSRLAKVGAAEPAGQMRDEKLHAVVARSTF